MSGLFRRVVWAPWLFELIHQSVSGTGFILYFSVRLLRIFWANRSLISRCLGTGSVFPVLGLW